MNFIKRLCVFTAALYIFSTIAYAEENISYLDKQIEQLVSVNLGDLKLVDYLEREYYLLHPEQREKIKNTEILFAAREKYFDLSRSISTLDRDILLLGEPDETKKVLFDSLIARYNALSEDEKKQVLNFDVLRKFEQEILLESYDEIILELQKPFDSTNCAERAARAIEFYCNCVKSDYRSIAADVAVAATAMAAKTAMDVGDHAQAVHYLDSCLKCVTLCDGLDELSFIRQQIAAAMKKLQPQNGEIMHGFLKGYGTGTITVITGDQPVVMVIDSTDKNKSWITVFVAANEQAKILARDGNFTVKYATGEIWFGEGPLFGDDTQLYQLRNNLEIHTLNDEKNTENDHYVFDLTDEKFLAENFVVSEYDNFALDKD